MCKDGFFEIWGGGLVGAFPRVVQWMGMPELLEKFGTPAAQVDPELKEEFEAIFYSWCLDRTKTEIWESAQKARVTLGPYNTIADLLASHQLQERRYWAEIEHPVAGMLAYPGAPAKMETPWQIRRPAPLLGEYNQEVYGELGYTRQDLTKLREQGVI